MRGRVVNPKWIAGVMRHGYKGAFEIAATVDYLFAFAATTGAVRDHHFDAVYQAFSWTIAFAASWREANPAALEEMAERLNEAIDRGLWTPRSNSAKFDLGNWRVPPDELIRRMAEMAEKSKDWQASPKTSSTRATPRR